MKINSTFSSLQLILLFTFIAFGSIQAEVYYATPLEGNEHMIGNLLKWETSIELNSKQFLVEKSQDGVTYSSIGKVESEGSGDDGQGYRFLDINATSDKSFYRLKQVDIDGSSSLSQTVLVKRTISNNFMVINMTNSSTNGSFVASIDVLQEASMTWELHNTSNEKVQSGSFEAYNGLNEIEVDLKDEAEGIYFLRMQIGNEMEVLTIRKILDKIQTKENVALKH